MKTLLSALLLIMSAGVLQAQTLTFLLRNGQVIAGPKFQYEVWIRSSDGTSRMGSILVYNNYNTLGFGTNVVANSHVTVTKNSADFGSSYGQNASNDNTASKFAYSWTYLGGAGSGVIIPSSGDGVLAFTVQIDIADQSQNAGLTFDGSLMSGEQFLDNETTSWPTIDATSTLDPPLPITLSSLSATYVSAGMVRVDWTTETETDNYGFEVQKSADTIGNYATIPNSFIPGHGTTIVPHSYSYTDSSASAGVWYYRLKQIDNDGTINYTDGVQVEVLTSVEEIPVPTVFALDQNYPNPFNPSTKIEFALPSESHVRLEVFNMLGQRVALLVDEVRHIGYYSVKFDAGPLGPNSSGLASGLYFYRLQARPTSSNGGEQAKEISFLKKMVLVK